MIGLVNLTCLHIIESTCKINDKILCRHFHIDTYNMFGNTYTQIYTYIHTQWRREGGLTKIEQRRPLRDIVPIPVTDDFVELVTKEEMGELPEQVDNKEVMPLQKGVAKGVDEK